MEKSHTHKRLMKATGIISLATFLSRVLGFVRDMVIASFFGTGMAADAFFIAFRIPNLLRHLFGEGALNSAFVPVFTEYLNKKTKKETWELVSNILCIISSVLIVISLLGVIFTPIVVKLIAPGFAAASDKYDLTVLLTRITFPYIFFVSLVALSMGILNTMHHFAAPALAPAFLNISIIAAAVILGPYFEQPVIALAIGVLIGGVTQLLLQIPFLLRQGIDFSWKFNLRHPGIKKVGLLMLPATLGLAVYEINSLVDTLMASYLPEGSVSYLYYANRLVQFPVGIFGAALSTALLPTLSHQAVMGDMEELKKTFSFALRMIFYICIPATIGLIVLREPFIRILFERGKFGPHATILTADALLYYTLGLCAFAGVKVVVPVFHSMQDTSTPVKISIIAMVINIFLNYILMQFLQHSGLALATSITGTLNLGWMIILLKRRLGQIGGGEIAASLVKTSLASLIMGVICWISLKSIATVSIQSSYMKAGILGTILGIGIAAFMVSSYLLKCEEFNFFTGLIKTKLKFGNK